MLRSIETKIVNPLFSVQVVPLQGTAPTLPEYATSGAAALDLRACLAAPVIIAPGKNALIKTGIAINMQDSSLVALVMSRSGLALKHQVFVLNAPGVIDSDYTGEIGVVLANFGDSPFEVKPGDRIAQLMFQHVVQVNLRLVDDFSTETNRGSSGFGSTGLA